MYGPVSAGQHGLSASFLRGRLPTRCDTHSCSVRLAALPFAPSASAHLGLDAPLTYHHLQLVLAANSLETSHPVQYGNGTLRLTTRQAYQLHGVLKQDLKTVFSSVIKNMGSTLAACGDVNRNVMAPPVPYKNRAEYVFAQQYAEDIAQLLAPQSGAYYDVWLDGEKFFTHQMEVGTG